MSVSYTYSIANDTLNGGIISDKLVNELNNSSISNLFEHVDTDNDNLVIWFSSALSSPQQTILTGIINAHSVNSLYIIRGSNNTFENSVVGWPDPSQVILSWNDATRTLTVSPSDVNFTFITANAIFTKTIAESVQIANTSGKWYIYYNVSGILTASTTFFNLLQDAPVAIIYWNASLSSATHVLYELHGDARYTPAMNKRSHIYLHNSLGTVYESGLDIGANTLLDGLSPQDPNADNRNTWLSLTGGNILDEDINCSIINGTNSNIFTQDLGTYPFPASAPSASNAAKIPVIYKLGSDGYWAKSAATNWPFPWNVSTNKIQYNQNNNGTYQLTDVPNGYFSVLCIIATPDIYDPIIVIPHNNAFENYDDAASATIHDVIPTRSSAAGPEYKVLYKLIYQTKYTYNVNTKYAKLVNINDFRIDAFLSATNSSNLGKNNQQYLSLSINASTTSTSYINLFSTNFTTSGGNVTITYISNDSNSGNGTNYFRLLINGTTVRYASNHTPSGDSSVHIINYGTSSLTSGTHTIAVQWRTSGNTARIRAVSNAEIESANLLIQEFY